VRLEESMGWILIRGLQVDCRTYNIHGLRRTAIGQRSMRELMGSLF